MYIFLVPLWIQILTVTLRPSIVRLRQIVIEELPGFCVVGRGHLDFVADVVHLVVATGAAFGRVGWEGGDIDCGEGALFAAGETDHGGIAHGGVAHFDGSLGVFAFGILLLCK